MLQKIDAEKLLILKLSRNSPGFTHDAHGRQLREELIDSDKPRSAHIAVLGSEPRLFFIWFSAGDFIEEARAEFNQ